MSIFGKLASWIRPNKPQTEAATSEQENPYTKEDLVKHLQYLANNLGCYVAMDQPIYSPIAIYAFRYKPELSYDPEEGDHYWVNSGHGKYYVRITDLVPAKMLEFAADLDYQNIYSPAPGPEYRETDTMSTRRIDLCLGQSVNNDLTITLNHRCIGIKHLVQQSMANKHVKVGIHLNEIATAFSVKDLESMLAYRRTQESK